MYRNWPKIVPLLSLFIVLVILIGQIGLPDQATSLVWVPVEPALGVTYVPDAYRGPAVRAHAAILFENTTRAVIFAKNEHTPRAPASLTKIMTALLAIEGGHLEDTATISRNAARMGGSSAHLQAGQELPLKDLLYAMLLPSGNDAAVAVAEHVGGSLAEFIAMMNDRARELGARHTHFANPHGLDRPGHLSTAFDLALLSRVALLYPLFEEIVGTRNYVADESGLAWKNTNKLLWSYEGTEGIKTGTTGQAGNCLAAAASRQDMQLISVVLGSSDRWQDSTKLLNHGFNNFDIITVAERGVPLAQVRLSNSTRPLVIVPASDVRTVWRQGSREGITTELKLHDLRLPVKRGAQIGTYATQYEGSLIAEIPLVAAEGVGRLTIWRWLWSKISAS